MNKTKKLYSIILILFSFMSVCAFAFLGNITAHAGVENKVIMFENFDNDTINPYYWRKLSNNDNTGITPSKNAFFGLNAVNVTGGTGVMASTQIEEGVRIEVDFTKYEAPTNSWMSFVFGTPKTQTDFVDYDSIKTGKNFFLNYNGEEWRIFSHCSFNLDLRDASGVALPVVGDPADAPIVRQFTITGLPSNNGVIENKTLSFSCDKEGYIEFSIREKGGIFDTRTVLAKNNTPLEKYYVGRVGTSFAGGSGYCNARIDDIRINKFIDSKEVNVAKINKEGENEDALKDFYQYISPTSEAFFYGQQGNLEFSKQSDSNSMVTLKKAEIVAFDSVTNKNLVVESRVGIKSLVGNKKVGIGFGLQNYLSHFKTAKTTYLYFTKVDDKIKYGAQTYVSNSESKEVLAPTALPANVDTRDFKLKLTVNGNSATVKFDEFEGATFNIDSYKGYFFLALDGATDENNYANVTFDDILINNNIYSTPINCDIEANFENGEINLGVWSLPSYGGNTRPKSFGVYAEDNVLKFDNVNQNANITSVPQYSNFEYSFDIVDILREPVYNDFGMLKPASSWIGVMFGISDLSYKDNHPYLLNVQRHPLITFSTQVVNGQIAPSATTTLGFVNVLDNGENAYNRNLPDKYNFFSSENADKDVNVKVTMLDGNLVISLKYSNETIWYEACSLEVGGAPIGSVALKGYGDGSQYIASTFSVDNIAIKNLDAEDVRQNNGKYPEISNQDGKTAPDFDYDTVLKPDNLLDGTKPKEQKGCNGAIKSTSCGFVLIAVLLAMTLFIKRRKA